MNKERLPRLQAFLVEAVLSHRKNDLRIGQACFNQLIKEDSELAERVRSTDIDPFYEDSKLEAFLEFVENAWIDSGINIYTDPDLINAATGDDE